jgi:hypothetical protein
VDTIVIVASALVIGGMTCAARVQAKLNRLDGVIASVNLSTERAWVSAPPDLSARGHHDPVPGLRRLEQPAPALHRTPGFRRM